MRIGILDLLAVLPIVLKAFDVVDWSWGWALMPLFILMAYGVGKGVGERM